MDLGCDRGQFCVLLAGFLVASLVLAGLRFLWFGWFDCDCLVVDLCCCFAIVVSDFGELAAVFIWLVPVVASGLLTLVCGVLGFGAGGFGFWLLSLVGFDSVGLR